MLIDGMIGKVGVEFEVWSSVDLSFYVGSVAVWLSGNLLLSINEVALCRARLVRGDRARGSTPGVGKSISICNQPSRSTQPSHPSVGSTMSIVMTVATAREENGEFCVTVAH